MISYQLLLLYFLLVMNDNVCAIKLYSMLVAGRYEMYVSSSDRRDSSAELICQICLVIAVSQVVSKDTISLTSLISASSTAAVAKLIFC